MNTPRPSYAAHPARRGAQAVALIALALMLGVVGLVVLGAVAVVVVLGDLAYRTLQAQGGREERPQPESAPRHVEYRVKAPDARRRLALAALVGRLPGDPFDAERAPLQDCRALLIGICPDVAPHFNAGEVSEATIRADAAEAWEKVVSPQPAPSA